MDVATKVDAMRADFSKIVQIFNQEGDHRTANVAQSVLMAVGNFNDVLREGNGKKGETEFQLKT